MKPVFQGFYGMVPNALKEKFPDARIKDQGIWGTYQRPAFLDPTDPLFDKLAAIYYEEQKNLFGEAQFFGGDPFHEGGTSEGINVKLAAQKILQAMRKVDVYKRQLLSWIKYWKILIMPLHISLIK